VAGEVGVISTAVVRIPMTGKMVSHATARLRRVKSRAMAEVRRKRPRDPIQLAKLIGDIATGQVTDTIEDSRNPAAVELGKLGGAKGGKARAAKLSPAKRRAIAKKAARARWE
jgi:hypothetical protein